jgi:hypothetical protein
MTSERECYVYLQMPESLEVVTCGRFRHQALARGVGVGRFVYGQTYRSRPDAVPLDPVHLPDAHREAGRGVRAAPATLRPREGGRRVLSASHGQRIDHARRGRQPDGSNELVIPAAGGRAAAVVIAAAGGQGRAVPASCLQRADLEQRRSAAEPRRRGGRRRLAARARLRPDAESPVGTRGARPGAGMWPVRHEGDAAEPAVGVTAFRPLA